MLGFISTHDKVDYETHNTVFTLAKFAARDL
jgi:hypothetical protein